MRETLVTSALLALFLALVTGLVLYKVLLISTFSLFSSFVTVYGLIASVFLISRIPYAYLHRDLHETQYPSTAYPSVTVVIAAKNEEQGIVRTIETCLSSDYPTPIGCIVIDDGSTDGTNQEVRRAQALYPDRMRLITFPVNRGKREAMAAGINEVKTDIIVFVDSDSFLAKDAVRHIVEHFMENPRIGAVAGNTKVENHNENILTRMQSIQYAVSFDIYKASESTHVSVTCCPGCFSAYRTAVIQPLAHDWKEQKFLGKKGTFGDDRGLTNFVLKSWDIVYCQAAQATTTVPTLFRTYWKQQLRWKKSWIREGLFAGLFMWRRHPLASFAFYTNFSFPIVGPILAGTVLIQSILTKNPFLFIIFIAGFLLLGIVFALFVRIHHRAKHWLYMPLFSILFVTIFMWQMPYAMLTLRKTHWGTR